MDRPILTLTTKDFLTGIAPSAHTERGGLFYSATGVTPIYDPGGTASTENGLLQAGPAPTEITGLADTIIAGDVGYISSTPYLFMLGDDGHLYRQGIGGASVTDLRSGTPITSPRNGLAVFEVSGANQLYYFQSTQVGIWDLSGTYPTGWSDGGYTGLTAGQHPCHKFLDKLFFGNVKTVGFFATDGSASYTALDFPTQYTCTALSDDDTYLVVAVTENLQGSNNYATNKILFWDTYSSSWQREFTIKDPFIWALKKKGSAVYAFGQYGIYQVTFGGVTKVLSRSIGFGTPADVTSGFGASRADVYNQDALIWATDTTVDHLGKISQDVPNAYFKPLKIPTSIGTPTFVNAGFDIGRVYVGTDGDKLYAYDFDGATRETGVSAQTIYFPLQAKVSIKRIDVIFGEPLASGDSLNIDTKIDEDTSAVDFGSATFTADGAIRRKSISPINSVTADEQISFVINWVGGAVKIKTIKVYGDVMAP